MQFIHQLMNTWNKKTVLYLFEVSNFQCSNLFSPTHTTHTQSAVNLVFISRKLVTANAQTSLLTKGAPHTHNVR